MDANTLQLDERQVRRQFGAAARTCSQHDVLYREVEAGLLQRLDFYLDRPERIIDVGAGTGRGAAALNKRYPKAHVLALDTAVPMLRQARRRNRWRRRFAPLAADAARLPLPSKSVDLIHSNLCIHWCNDLQGLLREWVRVLRPKGYLALTVFGPDTLRELRRAWAEVDDGPHVGWFPDMHDLGDAVFAAGFKEPVLDVSRYCLTYAEPMDLLHELQGLGATHAAARRRRGLTGRHVWQGMLEGLERQRVDGRIPATVEVVTVHAWGPVWRWKEPR